DPGRAALSGDQTSPAPDTASLAPSAHADRQPPLRRDGGVVPVRAHRARGPSRGPGDRPGVHRLVRRRPRPPAGHYPGAARRVRAPELDPATAARGDRSRHDDDPHHADWYPSPDPGPTGLDETRSLPATDYHSPPHLRGAENEPRVHVQARAHPRGRLWRHPPAAAP